MRAKVSPATGEIKKTRVLALNGMDCSFTNSLSASANGWGIPINLILLGPFRSWE